MGRRRYQQPSVFKTSGKRPMWYFRARVDTISSGRALKRPEERYYLGYCDEMTKQEAKKRRDEILAEAINRPQVLIPSQVKFSEVLTTYERDHLSALRDTSQATLKSGIKQMDGIGKLRMCDIDALAVQRWLSSLDLAYTTKKRYFDLLRNIWEKAEEWGYTQQRFPRGKFTFGVRRSVKGHEMPSMDQIRRLMVNLVEPYRSMAEVALCSGLRISEILGLKWEDVGAHSVTIRRRVAQKGPVDVPKSDRGNRVLDVRPLASVQAAIMGCTKGVQ